MDCDYLFKIVMIGDSGVGKTNIMTKFSRNIFSQTSKATIGVDFASRSISIDDKHIKIQIWDTAGQERYRAITSSYYRNSSGIMLVYDITNENTFEHCTKWLTELRGNIGITIPILLIGNKNDIVYQRTVGEDKAKDFAKSNNLMFMETSALDGTNIDAAFNILAKHIYDATVKAIEEEKSGLKAEDILKFVPPPAENIIVEENEIGNTTTKKSCC